MHECPNFLVFAVEIPAKSRPQLNSALDMGYKLHLKRFIPKKETITHFTYLFIFLKNEKWNKKSTSYMF